MGGNVDNNLKLTICAYFLSKFDMRAVKYLGYNTRDAAMKAISTYFEKNNHYLRRRRDEFDVLTGSHRQGQWARTPVPIVRKFHDDLKTFSFEELSSIVQELLNTKDIFVSLPLSNDDINTVVVEFSASYIEDIINLRDDIATLTGRTRVVLERVCDRRIADKLKALYSYRCQLCGFGTKDTLGYAIVEAHHIIPFSQSHNNNASNNVILCPNHHRLIHKANPVYNSQSKEFIYPNGHIDVFKYNFHL